MGVIFWAGLLFRKPAKPYLEIEKEMVADAESGPLLGNVDCRHCDMYLMPRIPDKCMHVQKLQCCSHGVLSLYNSASCVSVMGTVSAEGNNIFFLVPTFQCRKGCCYCPMALLGFVIVWCVCSGRHSSLPVVATTP